MRLCGGCGDPIEGRCVRCELRTDGINELLATYLTGSNYAAASIALGLAGGHAQKVAKPFFALREALGIRGYATREEALASIAAITKERGGQ